jgi:hypothetical protein
VSKDGGTTWSSAQYITFTAVEGSQDIGTGVTELWGSSWNGTHITDANFKVKIYAGSDTSFNSQIYGTANLDDDIVAGAVLTGVKISTEGKFATGTVSLDHITVTAYYGNSPLEIAEGALAHDSTLHLPSVYAGAAWVTLAPLDSPTFTGTVSATTIHTTTLLADHIGEHTGAHGIVFDNDITRVGKLSIDHIGEATGSHGLVLDNATTAPTVTQTTLVGCRAYLNTAQNDITAAQWNQVNLDAETYDIGSDFNTTTYTFTCDTAGYYLINGMVNQKNTVTAKRYMVAIYVDDAAVAQGWSHTGLADSISAFASTVIHLAVNSTVKLYCRNDSGVNTVDLTTGSAYTYLEVFLLERG